MERAVKCAFPVSLIFFGWQLKTCFCDPKDGDLLLEWMKVKEISLEVRRRLDVQIGVVI